MTERLPRLRIDSSLHRWVAPFGPSTDLPAVELWSPPLICMFRFRLRDLCRARTDYVPQLRFEGQQNRIVQADRWPHAVPPGFARHRFESRCRADRQQMYRSNVLWTSGHIGATHQRSRRMRPHGSSGGPDCAGTFPRAAAPGRRHGAIRAPTRVTVTCHARLPCQSHAGTPGLVRHRSSKGHKMVSRAWRAKRAQR